MQLFSSQSYYRPPPAAHRCLPLVLHPSQAHGVFLSGGSTPFWRFNDQNMFSRGGASSVAPGKGAPIGQPTASPRRAQKRLQAVTRAAEAERREPTGWRWLTWRSLHAWHVPPGRRGRPARPEACQPLRRPAARPLACDKGRR